MKILYLYSELMGYQMPVLKELVQTHGAAMDVVHWDTKKKTPYVPEQINHVSYIKRTDLNKTEVIDALKAKSYAIVYISGWMDKLYLNLARQFKRKGAVVVAGIDSQWNGTFKQHLGVYYYKVFYRKIFDKLWVPGPYQFEFVRRLGMSKEDVIFNCYTADNTKFLFTPKSKVAKKMLFLGRLEPVKGIDLLIPAWRAVDDKQGWKLDFIGSGTLSDQVLQLNDSNVLGFKSPEELQSLINDYDVLVLPSYHEPYALVIHEAMCAGLIVLASDCCGAVPNFIIEGETGYTFKTGSLESLKSRIQKIIDIPEEVLLGMQRNAAQISGKITPQLAAASLVSVIK